MPDSCANAFSPMTALLRGIVVPIRLREHARGRMQARRADAGFDMEQIAARAQRHHEFLERRVAGALADAGQRAFGLARARCDRGEAVRDGHAEIVVAMHREHGALDARHVRAQIADALEHLRRRRVADRVRNIQRAGAGVEHGAEHFGEVVGLGADRVFGGEFDVVAQLARAADRGDRGVDHLRLAHVELVLAMQRAGGEEDVDAPRAAGSSARAAVSMSLRLRARERRRS